MALAWAGEDTGRILVVVTEEMFIFMQVPTVYLSTDDGKTFANITNRLNNGQPALIAKDNGLQKSPVNSRKIYLVAHTNMATSDLYITEDAADTFRRVELPFTISGNIEFHPTNENFLLVVDSAVSWFNNSMCIYTSIARRQIGNLSSCMHKYLICVYFLLFRYCMFHGIVEVNGNVFSLESIKPSGVPQTLILMEPFMSPTHQILKMQTTAIMKN